MKIVVACHKPYWRSEDPLYCYVEAGAATHETHIPHMLRDDEGIHISAKNPTFCELTALYWAWKNLDADFLGLCHYRRFFAEKRFGAKKRRILSGRKAWALLQTTDVILPRKRDYLIETNYSQYIHAHHQQDLDTLREILSEKYPEYLDAFDTYMQKTAGHQFNMFLMKREILNAYCAWLFDVLFLLEERLDISGYSKTDQRVFGYVAERLVDTWLDTNHIPYRELPVVYLERQNWLKKGSRFLIRKWRAEGKR